MGTRAFVWSLVGAAACVVSSSAFAQSSGGTTTYAPPPGANSASLRGAAPSGVASFDPSRDTPRTIDSYQHMIDFGSCAANLGEGQVAEILASQAESRVEKHDLAELQRRVSSCTRMGVANILSLQRGVLAEGLYLKKHDEAPKLASYGATQPEYAAFKALEDTRNALRGKSDQVMISATDCLVAQQPTIADKILRSPHGSDAEERAMDSLFAYAPQCAGSTRPDTLSKSFLRAFVADSMYQYAGWKTKQQSASKN